MLHGQVTQYYEMECGEVGSDWDIINSAAASNGQYARISSGYNSLGSPPSGEDARISIRVHLENSGNYRIFGHVNTPSGSDDSFWVRVNSGTWYRWNDIGASSGWEWKQVHDNQNGNALLVFPFDSGYNIVDIAYREDGALIDKIAVTSLTTAPTGLGDDATNCSEICGNGIDDDGNYLTDCEDGGCASEAACQGPCVAGQIFSQRWTGVSGSAVSAMTSLATYPDNPNEISYLYEYRMSASTGDNYGTRTTGYIIPTTTGDYTFNITGDDEVQLYLSTDNDEANKSLIANIPGWTGQTNHNTYPSQTSVTISLQAGVWYYTELLHKEGGGGDHFAVHWRTSSSAPWVVIPGSNLAPSQCPEICDNIFDDDGDGDADCTDSDCGTTATASIFDDEICIGESTTLSVSAPTASGPYQYAWSGGSGNTSSVTVSPSSSTTYTVTVTNRVGCTSTDQVAVTVNPLPNADAGSDQTLCTGGIATLSASGGATYQWSNGLGNSANASASPISTTTYTVTVTSSAGCTATDQVTINVIADPTATVSGGDVTVCTGDQLALIGIISGGTGSPTFQWQQSFRNDIWRDISGATSQVYNTPPMSASSYYRVVITFSGAGCNTATSAPSLITVDRKSIIVTVTEGQEICEGESVTLVVNEDIDNGDLLDNSTWTVGTGSAPGFTRVGTTAENHRVIDKDPWGNDAVVWEARPDAASNADGGFLSAYMPVDELATYRYSVWVNRRSISTVGRFYFGLRTSGTSNQAIRIATDAPNSNPYFWISDNGANNLIHDEWVLVVAHLHPSNYTGTTNHPESGRYTANGGRYGGITEDYKFSPGTDEARLRTFMYYSTDVNHIQQFLHPRIDRIDGTEPSVQDILDGFNVNGGLGTGASFEWSAGTCGTTSEGTGNTLTVSPSATTEYFVTASGDCNTTSCFDSEVTVNEVPDGVINNDGPITCNDGTVILSVEPLGQSYLWSDGSTAQLRNVTTPGTYTVTITSPDDCQDIVSTEVLQAEDPEVAFIGDSLICVSQLTYVTPSSDGEWSSSDTDVAIISNDGTIVGVAAGTATFTFTESATGCSSTTGFLSVSPEMSLAIDYGGSICLTDDSELSVDITGGTAPFTYEWAGPSTSSTASSIDVDESGNYYVTVTDSYGCEEEVSGFVYQEYDPYILTLNTEVCEGEEVDLTVNSASAIAYQWSANAGSSTSGSVTVTPGVPSSTYYVTITNDVGCTSVADMTVTVYPKTDVDVTGATSICEEETTTLSPTSGGEWTSSDPSIATVSPDGTVTGQSAGTVTFIFRDSINNCNSDPTEEITVYAKPLAEFVGDNAICEGEPASLTPNSGGEWTSSDESVAIISDAGVVTTIGPGSVNFTFVNTTTGCISDPSADLTIYERYDVSLTGDNDICQGETVYLFPVSNGEWVSNDENVATVSSTGVVSAIGGGTAIFTFTSEYNCVSSSTIEINVTDNEQLTIDGQLILCEDESTTLTGSMENGTWSSSNNTIVSIDALGTITGIAEGMATISYIPHPDSCALTATAEIEILRKPTVALTGPANICVDEYSKVVTPSINGTWISTDPSIAIIANSGDIIGISGGSVAFLYEGSNGCYSDTSTWITVNPELSVDISYNGSVCLEDNTELQANVTGGTTDFDYLWSGPGGFTASTQTIAVPISGNYTVQITDGAGCIAMTSAYVYERYEPYIFTLETDICEGQEITLAVNGSSNGSFQWSSNAGGGTDQSVTLTPSVPGATYTVTVTSSVGCTSIATADIHVDATPVITLEGDATICEGETTSFSSDAVGVWSSSDFAVASIDEFGVVTGRSAGTATIIFRNLATGCYSAPSGVITVEANNPISVTGSTDLCRGTPEFMAASVPGGVWTSTNVAVATVDPSSGLVTPVTQGTTTIEYTVTSEICYEVGAKDINIFNLPAVNINGPSTICEGSQTILVPGSGGTWASSDPTVASVNALGIVKGEGGGTATFTFTTTAGCVRELPVDITVIADPNVTNAGDSTLCINETAQLTSDAAGLWISSNPLVASVSSSGVVTALRQGVAEFSFVEFSNGCIASEVITISVFEYPVINGLNNNTLCVGEETYITPSTGGTWESSNPLVAEITDGGIITAVGAGVATFVFTNSISGCSSQSSAPLLVNGRPSITVTGPTTLCVGSNSSILPNGGGTWTSSDVTVATITSEGIITAVSQGDVTFSYTNDAFSCPSLPSDTFTINNPTPASITGINSLCAGESQTLNGSHDGAWTSNNPSIATVNNAGVFTALAPGSVRVTLTTFDDCTENPTFDISVNPVPNVLYDGPSALCIGSTTNMLPNSGGTWTSSADSVATISNDGSVVAHSMGNATFTFTNDLSGCSASASLSLTVYEKPTATISGDDEICIGGVTSLSPSSGGSWTSTDENIATISSTGVVNAISAGEVQFIYEEFGTGCISDPSAPVTVVAQPIATIVGDNTICIGDSTELTPNTGGAWISSNESVATISDEGIVVAQMQGIVRFTFVSNAGCASNESAPVIIFGTPTVVDGASSLCIGEHTQLQPQTGVEWFSSDNTTATIDDSGLVTALEEGTVTFYYRNVGSGCFSEDSQPVTINPVPNTALNGPSTICIGTRTYLVPSAGGVWSSNNPDVATILNNGQVTGESTGTATFTFTDLTTGCSSLSNVSVTVGNEITPVYDGPQEICVGDTTYLLPNSDGVWTSTDEEVASIDDSGMVIALSQGLVQFQYEQTGTGCLSSLSDPLLVHGSPTVVIAGPPSICIGGETQLTSGTAGDWIALNPSIAIIDMSGIVTGVSDGDAYFQFVDGTTGCSSGLNTLIQVQASPTIEITGPSEICVGYTTTLSPSIGGLWSSSNPSVATISSSGVVSAIAPGEVVFEFIDNVTGCVITGSSDIITISDCRAHDFNVTTTTIEVKGDISTNDNMPMGSTYSPVVQLLEKPTISVYDLTINSDGTYTFEADKAGKYLFAVGVCGSSQFSGCPTMQLEITVVDNIYSESNPAANLDIATTIADVDPNLAGGPISINAIANDECVYTVGCLLDPASMSTVDDVSNGAIAYDALGNITYTPDEGFVGYDTLTYQVCDAGGSECSSSQVVFTVNDSSAANSVTASDDFAFTMRGISTSGTVMENDTDPEGDMINVVPQGSAGSPVSMADGSYYIDASGNFEFTPNPDFNGGTEIIYTVCDDNAEVACTDATLHILVFDDIALNIRVYLEGALMHTNGDLSTQGRPIMRDDLRVNPFTGENNIKQFDPYKFAIDEFTNLDTLYNKLGPHLSTVNQTIVDSAAVFGVSGDNAIVDWIHIELRSKDDVETAFATRSGLLQRDGDVVDLDGVSPLRFQGVNVDSFYVVAKHRSHLGVMTQKVHFSEFIDFTDVNFPLWNYGTTYDPGYDYTGYETNNSIKPGFRACWAGDLDSNGKIKFSNPDDDNNIVFQDVLFSSPEFLINFDLAHGYYSGDFDMNGKVKYTNPNDDRNMLFSQLLLFPLNTAFGSQFDFFIQQVPPSK